MIWNSDVALGELLIFVYDEHLLIGSINSKKSS